MFSPVKDTISLSFPIYFSARTNQFVEVFKPVCEDTPSKCGFKALVAWIIIRWHCMQSLGACSRGESSGVWEGET